MTRTATKKKFLIRITYFKPNGKSYTSDTFEWEGAGCGPDGNTCYMNDVAAHVRGLLQSGGQGSLYGLSATNGGWDGPVLIDCDEGFPVLLNLKKAEE